MLWRRRTAGIRQKDDFCFKSLGGMDGHDPHRSGAGLHVALDRIFQTSNIVEKTRERRRGAGLMRQGEVQKFIKHIACLGPEPCQKIAASAIRAEKSRIKSERPAARALPP